MQDLTHILAAAPEKQAFSNSSSWEIWSYNWCRLCRHDINEDCPLVLAGFMGYTPLEWVPAEAHG